MKVDILIVRRTVRKKEVNLEGASQLADRHQPEMEGPRCGRA